MARAIESTPAGGPASPARPLRVSRARTGRRLLADRLASRLVIVGGLVIIGSILAILVVIAAEVAPLFRKPWAERLATGDPVPVDHEAPAPGESVGTDEYRELAYELGRDGMLRFVGLRARRDLPPVPIPGLGDATVTAVAPAGQTRHAIGTSDGRTVGLDMRAALTFPGGRRVVTPNPEFGEPAPIDPVGARPVLRLAFAAPESGPVTVAQLGPRELAIRTVVEKKALIGPSRREASLRELPVPGEGEITALRLDDRAEDLFIGTARGEVIRVDLREREAPRADEPVPVTGGSGVPVTVLGFLIGDRTLVVGDRAGGVSSWQVLRPAAGQPRLARISRFEGHGQPVVALSASARDKGFVTADASGTIRLHYGTSGRTLLSLGAAGAPLRAVVFAPKADGILAFDERGGISHWQLHNRHPEVTLGTLFGRVWYEGYPEPEHVWQSTGGTDDFEAKLSLTPLVFGTLKGTLYAMLFAVPRALLAALYVSEFVHPTVKGYVKPVVEIMAALPSVVLGFLAGLWLAPAIERVVPGLALMPVVVPAAILVALLAWTTVPRGRRARVRPGGEIGVLVPAVVAGTALAFWLGSVAESALLGGSYRAWLLSALGLTYDQRNSLVVGIAMGFAVIPIVFTIAEDALANVPQHLRAGSLALGATPWQTALQVVLPTASPGIFSAVMIGFGRAVGETMIVLMATGNTPVTDWSLFNGFRALSANIAVELPEAPEGGTLFRVLFLAALLLFCFTFLVNTVAELVRLRLRRRYRYL